VFEGGYIWILFFSAWLGFGRSHQPSTAGGNNSEGNLLFSLTHTNRTEKVLLLLTDVLTIISRRRPA
jgi:hypothetical protein